MSTFRDLLATELPSATVSTLANGSVLHVNLDATASKAGALQTLLDHVDVIDMTAGKYRKTDTSLRLNIRGQVPDTRTMVVISAPFAEPRQIELIQSQIRRQRSSELVTRLADLEQRRAGRTRWRRTA